MKCMDCGKEMTERVGTHHYLESGLDNVYVEGVTIWECPDGHQEVELPGEKMDRVDQAIADWLLNKKSLFTGPEVRFLRKRMRLSGKALAGIMGVSNVTVSRWEGGALSIKPVQDHLLRLIYAGWFGLRTKELSETVFPEIQPEVSQAGPVEMRL